MSDIPDKIYEYKEMKMRDLEKAVKPCGCYNCMSKRTDSYGLPLTLSTFIVCPICGNKRCPKATDHSLECSGSNKPGQEGSRY